MDVSYGKTRSYLYLRIICLYNSIAFFLVMRMLLLGWSANREAGIPTFSFGVFFFLGIAAVFFFSTLGLWYEKTWAFLTQLVLYALQLFIVKNGDLSWALYLGPDYVITFSSTKAGGISLGVNVVALTLLVLLVLSKRAFLNKR